jgi:hypothetical protein
MKIKKSDLRHWLTQESRIDKPGERKYFSTFLVVEGTVVLPLNRFSKDYIA